MIKNYMEDIVIKELNNIFKQLKDVCKCEKCREDMVAWTLNQLSPKYVVSDLGNLYTNLEQLEVQNKANITVLLVKAAEIVKKNPRH